MPLDSIVGQPGIEVLNPSAASEVIGNYLEQVKPRQRDDPVAVAGGAKVKLYYWDGNSWEYITENPGGWPPGGISTEVKQYYNGNYLHLLAVGNTKPGNRWAKCDIGRLE